MNVSLHTLAVGFPSIWEFLVIAMVAVFIFRRRIPHLARYLGGCVADFKCGFKAVEDDGIRK
jgi:Sec-independent protein translocase protein TatA